MLKFGEKSISLSADDKLVSRAEDLDMLSDVQIEISGVGFSEYELKIVRDGEKVALLINCGDLHFLVSGLTMRAGDMAVRWRNSDKS